MAKDVIAAAQWLRTERERLELTVDTLIDEIDKLVTDFRWEGEIPDAADVEALERGEPKCLPRWFKLARYAIERAELPDGAYIAWLEERNYYRSLDPLRMTRPLLFEDEWRFIATLDALEEDHRRAIRAFVSDIAHRQCYTSTGQMADTLLARLGIEVPALDAEEREMVAHFRVMQRNQRTAVLQILRRSTRG